MNLDTILSVAVAIALYLAAIQIVRLVERRLGWQFGNHRPLVFVVVFLVLLVAGLKLVGFQGFSGIF